MKWSALGYESAVIAVPGSTSSVDVCNQWSVGLFFLVRELVMGFLQN